MIVAALALAMPSIALADEHLRGGGVMDVYMREEVAARPPTSPAPAAAPAQPDSAPRTNLAAPARPVSAPRTNPAAPARLVSAPRTSPAAPEHPVSAPRTSPAAPEHPASTAATRPTSSARPPAVSHTRRVAAAPHRTRRPPPPCLSPPVEIVRLEGQTKETEHVSLTFCDGRPVPAALDTLSVLGRPHGVPAPSARELRAYARRVARRPRRGETPADPAYVVEGVLRLEAGLVPRVARIAARFAGKTIEVISGWRPTERLASRHHHGRALDLRIRGVARETLRDFARSLDETGVGYYPNSVFVHVDVRDRRAYWVDRSGPGEEADYGSWPPPAEEQMRTRDRIVADTIAALHALRVDVPEPDAPPAPAADTPSEIEEPETDAEQGAGRTPEPSSNDSA